MIEYTMSVTRADLEGILQLQQANLAKNLAPAEIAREGFVTVVHSFEQLQKLNDREKHVIAKDGDKVIGYLLAMTQEAAKDIPVLIPMFNAFEHIARNGKKVSDYHYLVVGQVCVDKAYRGQGILDECYAAYRKYYGNKYDFAITEIDSTNLRSRHAHRRIGFSEIHTYPAPGGAEWVVVLWDWK